MLLPIGDFPNSPRFAWMNYLLIAANVAVFVLLWPQTQRPADRSDPAFRQYVERLAAERDLAPRDVRQVARSMSEYDLFLFKHGFRPDQPAVLGILAGMFLHGGLLHLAGNMLFLWIYGDNVEARLGSLFYLVAYLASGAAAAMADSLLRPGSGIPAVGASGAISGVLGMYFVWFPQNRVRLFVFLFPFFVDIIAVPARFVLIVFLVLDNLLPLLLAGSMTGVAYGAHIGGFAVGVLLALVLSAFLRRR